MVGDEVTVVHVDKSYGTLHTPERFKDYVVTGIKHRQPENWESPMVDTRYYEITPIGETQEQRLGRMLAGGGMVRKERLYSTDGWVLRKGFLRGEHLSEGTETKKLNPQLMIGDEILVVNHGYERSNKGPELYRPYQVASIKQSNNTQETYYGLYPLEQTDDNLLASILDGGGKPREILLYQVDNWILRPGFRRGELEEEPNEIARTLSKARKHGVGTRFPKAAIKANPQRFRKYTRDKYLKEQTELSPALEKGDIIRVIDVDGEHEKMPERFGVYLVQAKGERLPDREWYLLHPVDHMNPPNRLLDVAYMYHGDTWVKTGENIFDEVISEHQEHRLNPELEVGDKIRVVNVDREIENSTTRYNIPSPELRPEKFTAYKVVDKESNGSKSKYPFRYTLVPEDKFEEYQKSVDRGYGDYEGYEKLLFPWVYDWIAHKSKISEQVNPEDYGIVDGEKRDAEAAQSNTPGAPDRTPFTKLESTILKQLHKTLDRSELQAVVEETPGDWGSGKKFWNVMKIFGVNYTRNTVEDTRMTKYAKWALDNWTEDGDYASIERPIKEKLKWFEIDREETGSQVEYKDGSAEVLGFDEDDASTRADYDFYAWGGEMETSDYGDYETYDSEITRSDFIRVDEGLTPKMVEELKGPKETQELLFNFWKKHGPTLDPDRLKLIGFNMYDADDRTKVEYNLVAYYGDEELINVITDRLEGLQDGVYQYIVTSIDFHDLLNFNTYPLTIMVDVVVDGSIEVPVSTEDGVVDITLWEANERAHKEWKGRGPGPYDNLYEEVREEVLGDINILLENLPVEAVLDYLDFSDPNESIDKYVGTPEIMTESKIDKLVWKEKPSKKHEKRMEKDLGIFDGFPIKDFMKNNPPKNSSEEAMDELILIDSLPVIDKFVKTTDHIFSHFKPYFKKNKLKLPEKELKDILKHTSPIILKLKYHYNRPRPQQLANEKGLDFHQQPLESARTPSYPSGHSTQGRLLAHLLSDKYPKHETEIKKLGNEIGTGRLVAKVHYPSDDVFGKELGDELYRYIKDKKVLEEQVMVDKGQMLKADIFKFLSSRFTLATTGHSEIKDNNGNYYRIIDIENPYESVSMSDLLEPAVEMVSYGIKDGIFSEGDIQKAIEAVTDWLSLSMNQKKDLMN